MANRGGGGGRNGRRALTIMLAALLSARPAAAVCIGDFDGDGRVLVAELVSGVAAALGRRAVAETQPFDANGDGRVLVNELVAAVANALHGCPTPTPTASGTATPSPSPTPSASPSPTGGERIRRFAVAPGDPRGTPDETRSGFFTTAVDGSNVAAAISEGPLTLQLGVADANGVAALALREDATIGVTFLDDTCLCITLLAETAVGELDCDGGTAYDTIATRPDGSPDFTWSALSGNGEPAPAGNGILLVMGRFERVSMRCEAADCPNRGLATPPNLFAFTTANATAVQETSGAPLSLTVAGEPFSCAEFATSGSGGAWVVPIPATIPPIGDVANVLRLAERP